MSNIIVCDLDGTLIKTDMLFESVFLLIKQNPIYLFFLPIWVLKGKAYLKNEIDKREEEYIKLAQEFKTFKEKLHILMN